jgi:hypothetical protein
LTSGAKLSPREKFSPLWGWSDPLGVKFSVCPSILLCKQWKVLTIGGERRGVQSPWAPRGEVRNGPQEPILCWND